jgi:hypothetical protein
MEICTTFYTSITISLILFSSCYDLTHIKDVSRHVATWEKKFWQVRSAPATAETCSDREVGEDNRLHLRRRYVYTNKYINATECFNTTAILHKRNVPS